MHHSKRTPDDFSHQPFRDLKKLLKKKKAAQPPPPVQKKDAAPLTDEEVFTSAMKEVREIKEYRDLSVTKRPARACTPYKNTESDNDALKMLEEVVSGRSPMNLPDTQEYVEWAHPDYREDILQRLHSGQYAVEDCLDLHGVVVEDASEEVGLFFRECVRKGLRCVKIIHGRGRRSPRGPVIKQSLVSWLLRRYRKHIIAFVTARQCDGGLGALYVLLK